MKRLATAIAGAALCVVATSATRSEVLFASAKFDPAYRALRGGGFVQIFSGNHSSLGNPQWLGARFYLSEPEDITGFGGLIGLTRGTLFGAIIALPSGTGLPSGPGFWDLVYKQNLTDVPTVKGGFNTSVEYIQHIKPVEVQPGWYGLVFGASKPTTGLGNMQQIDGLDYPDASYFSYGNQGQFPGGARWQQASFVGTRFVVEGHPVDPIGAPGRVDPIGAPERSTWVMMLVGLAGLALAKNRSWWAGRQERSP
jgi:hypothetical protein